jgi:hypothetical protein
VLDALSVRAELAERHIHVSVQRKLSDLRPMK